MNNFFFTSESVTQGHPDKMCDQISDAVLDRMLEANPLARVACESSITTGMVFVMGEINATNGIPKEDTVAILKAKEALADIPVVVRNAIKAIGHNGDVTGAGHKSGFDWDKCAVMTSIDPQSACIAGGGTDEVGNTKDDSGVNIGGAGDQGMMFGYACDETPVLMPAPISVAHKLAKRLSDVIEDGTIPYINPDGKSQVTYEYVGGIPTRIENIVISVHHDYDVNLKELSADVKRHVIDFVVPQLASDTKIYINPTGSFVRGGPLADSGLTGRKIIVDTYGGYARHGGGAFSGKDPTKVDRSAAYAARYLAKNVVASGLATKCELQISYAIGIDDPLSVLVDTFGTGKVDDARIKAILLELFSLKPKDIITQLDLRRPIYRQLAAYGHMGREDLVDIPWERTNLVNKIRELCSVKPLVHS